MAIVKGKLGFPIELEIELPSGGDGTQGSPGRDGRDGRDGVDGVDGLQGRKGDKGDKGDPGTSMSGDEPLAPVPPVATGEEIQALLDREFRAELPVGRIELSAPLVLRSGMSLIGHSSNLADRVGRGPGTTFFPADGYTGDGIVTQDFWHHGEVRNIGVRGFRGNGMAVREGMGENSFIDGCFFGGNTEHGLALMDRSGTPVQIGRISVHGNGLAGLYMQKQNHTLVQAQYVAGDNNGTALVFIKDGNKGTNIQILGWKSERWGANPGHPDIILIHDLNGGIVTLGKGRFQASVDAPGAVVHQTWSNGGPGLVSGLVTMRQSSAAYKYGYRDDKNNITVSVDDLLRKQFTNIPTLVL